MQTAWVLTNGMGEVESLYLSRNKGEAAAVALCAENEDGKPSKTFSDDTCTIYATKNGDMVYTLTKWVVQ